MYAELQSHGMEAVANGLEATVNTILHGRGEPAGRGQVTAIIIEDISLSACFVILSATKRGMVAIPADVYDHILPATLCQAVVDKIPGILHNLLLGY